MKTRKKATAAIASLTALLIGGGALATAEVSQRGNLRVSVSGQLKPSKLPRKGAAPIRVSVASQIATTDESQPPHLRHLRIEINRNGRLSTTGLPICPFRRIQTSTSAAALRLCRAALVGQGSFEAEVSLSNQEPYAAQAKLLMFNGRAKGKPVLLGQVYSARPFTTSFVIIFKISKKRKGTYGTVLNATLPRTLGAWGVVTGIKISLWRLYGHRGKRRSFLSAGCPAPRGFPQATFPLARTSFRFDGGARVRTTLTRTCRARR